MEPKGDIALIGLAVMGQNLILNMNDHGFTVCAFNRTVSKVDDFLANEAKGTKVIGAQSIEDLMGKLKKPRRVVMLVKAGQAVDDFIEKILPFTEEGDIIIDGGNSLFTDSIRRTHYLEGKKRLCECAAKVCVVGICNEGRHRRANRARGSKQKLARGTSNEVSWMQTTY